MRSPEKSFKPNRESFHLMTAKVAYVKGNLTVTELEQSVEHVLKGGTLDQSGHITPKDIQAFKDGFYAYTS